MFKNGLDFNQEIHSKLTSERENFPIVEKYTSALNDGLMNWALDGCRGNIWNDHILPACEKKVLT